MKRIPYTPELDIRNTEHLASGTGARYLLCMQGENDALIAKAWKRCVPKKISEAECIVEFVG